MKYKYGKDIVTQDERRIYWCIKNKIKHFAPTISPAPKNPERQEIESLYSALEYYRDAGVEKCIVQKKYMGSYCDIELHKDLQESRLFSRNAFLINHLDRDQIIEGLKPLHGRFDWDKYKKILIQAELLPWSAMGKGLIDEEFRAYGVLWENHLNYLNKSSLYEKLTKLTALQKDQIQQFLTDESTLEKSELQKKYRQHEKTNLSVLGNFKWLDLEGMQKGLDIQIQQTELFGKHENINFKPFNVLKYIWAYGSETIETSNIKGFKTVSDDETCVVELNDFDVAVKSAYQFYDKVTAENHEGVVVKPENVFVKDIVHCFKVRNHNYLHMIYGANFGIDYQYYLEKRNTKKKMMAQIQQWEIAQNLLLLQDDEIHDKNKRYRELLEKRFVAERRAVTLDSRL